MPLRWRLGAQVLLEGQVGAGKTTFARGFVRTFTGDAEVTVASPSFLLHLQYPEGGRCTLHHLDLYRLLPDRDISFLGLEALLPSGVALIEWPSPRLAPLLPPSLLTVRIEEESDGPSQPVASSAAPAAVPLPDSDSAMHAEASLSSAEGGGAGEEGHYGREELPEMDAPRRVTLVQPPPPRSPGNFAYRAQLLCCLPVL
jgi:tRNA threonylcarbamoyl adenosine modification protein YjeE